MPVISRDEVQNESPVNALWMTTNDETCSRRRRHRRRLPRRQRQARSCWPPQCTADRACPTCRNTRSMKPPQDVATRAHHALLRWSVWRCHTRRRPASPRNLACVRRQVRPRARPRGPPTAPYADEPVHEHPEEAHDGQDQARHAQRPERRGEGAAQCVHRRARHGERARHPDVVSGATTRRAAVRAPGTYVRFERARSVAPAGPQGRRTGGSTSETWRRPRC